MIYGSICSGIEAATVAWHPLGWRPAFFSEIEAFPRAVLQHHYPDVPLHGDFTTIKGDEYGAIDILCGGTPCQSFSVAGLRGGLADDRGNLALEFIRLAERTKPRWLVWENVPGVLSSNGGRDFAAFLGGLAECGYGFAYRVLDAQYFGVPQLRRRVVLIGYLGDWRPPAAVLFERESLRGDLTPSRIQGAEASSGSRESITGRHFRKLKHGKYTEDHVAGTVSARDKKGDTDLIAYGLQGCWIGRQPKNGGNAVQPMIDLSPCLTTADHHAVSIGNVVRRYSPVETERLQGFPDGYTDIQYKGRPAPDAPRREALGNSWAVPKFRWIGERIQMIEAILSENINTNQETA